MSYRILTTFCVLLPLGLTAELAVIEYLFNDRSLNPANGLEGPLPQAQPPSSMPDGVDGGDWRRSPSLQAAYLAGGYGSTGWTADTWLEWSISVQPGYTLRLLSMEGFWTHHAANGQRQVAMRAEASLDNFQSAPQLSQHWHIGEQSHVGEGVHALPPIDLSPLTLDAPLHAWQTVTLRIFAMDADDTNPPQSPLPVIGWTQRPSATATEAGADLVVRLEVLPAVSWRDHYSSWTTAAGWQGSSAEPLADADGDGTTNLYAFFQRQLSNGQATHPNGVANPLQLVAASRDRVQLKITRHPEAVGLRWTVEESSDLRSWRNVRTRVVAGDRDSFHMEVLP